MTTLPTDAERAQARAEHLAAIADCFELDADAVVMHMTRLRRLLPWGATADVKVADLDEARAIRDRLAELIEDAETGGGE